MTDRKIHAPHPPHLPGRCACQAPACLSLPRNSGRLLALDLGPSGSESVFPDRG